MKIKEKAISALLAVFPTTGSLSQFAEKSDNAIIYNSLIDYAVRNDLIKTTNENNFETFINRNADSAEKFIPPKHLNFENFLEKKDELLRLNLSLRAITGRINAFLAAERIALPKVTNSMLTRLKKEPADTVYKQNVLRSFAFWLGHERPDLTASWNFETMVKLCSDGKQTENYTEGVRIGVALYSRGDVIDHEILGWLKKALKNYVEQSISHFLYGHWGKIRSHDITTLYIDFPKEEEGSDPVSYRKCLRSAVDLAHQITIRWALSRYCTKNRFLSLGIVAGEYSNLDNYLIPLLNAKLPDDPVIRVSDYARQCLLINDIRVILCQHPTETALFNGEALTIWWVTAFWSAHYFDFVGDLLTDKILQNNAAAIEKLNRLLWFPEEVEQKQGKVDEGNSVSTFFKFPHNSLLGVEIAKTLYFRRRFEEAEEILRIVLSINPTDLIARTLRMLLFRNMAVDAENYSVALGLFKMSEKEAEFIQENCAHQSEDFFCEYAVVYLARAMLTLRHTRTDKNIAADRKTLCRLKQNVFDALDRAEDLFEKGMTISPSGIRSSYLLCSVLVLRAVLKSDEKIFINPQKAVDADFMMVRKPASELLSQIGYLRKDLPENLQYQFMAKKMINKLLIHDDSISLQSYRPTIFFCNAVALWDFLPARTVGTTKVVLQTLRKTIDIARLMEKDDVCIYSFTRTYGEMISAPEFIEHIEKAIVMIEKTAGKNLYEREDSEVIAMPDNLSSLLMTVNF
jgi:tetratricopeptide (TPR) repeat protein